MKTDLITDFFTLFFITAFAYIGSKSIFKLPDWISGILSLATLGILGWTLYKKQKRKDENERDET